MSFLKVHINNGWRPTLGVASWTLDIQFQHPLDSFIRRQLRACCTQDEQAIQPLGTLLVNLILFQPQTAPKRSVAAGAFRVDI
ncbi:hypothetical protein K435DRAFT_786642 [Dendrothele bispora CBS 962.96]|uniref:Uncharacterized protein n=1 Tax=Dendrothele bispora (strain CBS 962.96) TaxID=1314807 RepID=A0A4S8KPU3_DENBC|nr:hypothetical protein K435DRAFT_786642 [Dendrothele bispora CBS 962.96]